MSSASVVKNDIMYDIIKYTELCLNSCKCLASQINQKFKDNIDTLPLHHTVMNKSLSQKSCKS